MELISGFILSITIKRSDQKRKKEKILFEILRPDMPEPSLGQNRPICFPVSFFFFAKAGFSLVSVTLDRKRPDEYGVDFFFFLKKLR